MIWARPGMSQCVELSVSPGPTFIAWPLDQCWGWKPLRSPPLQRARCMWLSSVSGLLLAGWGRSANDTMILEHNYPRGQRPCKGSQRRLSGVIFPQGGRQEAPWSPLPCGRAEKLGVPSTTISEPRDSSTGETHILSPRAAPIASWSQGTPSMMVNSAKCGKNGNFLSARPAPFLACCLFSPL